MKQIQLPEELEGQVDDLVSQGLFHTFQSAVEELIRIGLSSIKGSPGRSIPPGSTPQPERPIGPDPTRDILKM